LILFLGLKQRKLGIHVFLILLFFVAFLFLRWT